MTANMSLKERNSPENAERRVRDFVGAVPSRNIVQHRVFLHLRNFRTPAPSMDATVDGRSCESDELSHVITV